MTDLSPQELGEAIKRAIRDGADLHTIDSEWFELPFPFDCAGLVPVMEGGDLDDEVPDLLRAFLYPCGLDEDQVVHVWSWYRSLPRQGQQCCVVHPGEFICATRSREAKK